MNTTTLDYSVNLNDITPIKILLQYNNVKIYEAYWRFDKVIAKEISNNKTIDNELIILSKCIHPKIVQFFGAHKGTAKTTMIFEYMENGNLYDYVRDNTLDAQQKLLIMTDITRGLHYLHEREPNIILHRDLKPANILINKYGEAKISDFGISKLVDKKYSCEFTSHSGEQGTYVWMSPEVLNHETYNYQADIYSLGLIFYYIWKEKIPWSETNMNTIQLMFAKNQNTLELDLDKNDPVQMLIDNCTSYQKKNRPNTTHIINALYKYLYELTKHD